MHSARSVHTIAMRSWLTIFAILFVNVAARAVQAPARTPSTATQATRRAPSAGRKPEVAKSDPDMAWLQDILKNPDLMNEVNHLAQRLGKEVQYPQVRTQSAIFS